MKPNPSPPAFSRRHAALFMAGGVVSLIASAGIAKPVKKRWSANLATTAIGSHIYGNPAAKVHLIEYFSYTCSHCADFALQTAVPLKTLYLDKGTVAVEYRNLVRDPVDLTAALLARCGGSAAFFDNHQAIFASQKDWLTKGANATEEQARSWQLGDLATRARQIATDTGLYPLMRKRGYSDAQISAALGDGVALAEIFAMTNLAQNTDLVAATPSFLINGKLLASVHEWGPLKVRIDAALRAA